MGNVGNAPILEKRRPKAASTMSFIFKISRTDVDGWLNGLAERLAPVYLPDGQRPASGGRSRRCSGGLGNVAQVGLKGLSYMLFRLLKALPK